VCVGPMQCVRVLVCIACRLKIVIMHSAPDVSYGSKLHVSTAGVAVRTFHTRLSPGALL